MSGGSMDYLFCKVKEYAVGIMGDPELDDLMNDIADLLHDAEWWHSGDIGDERYRQSVTVFKRKWFQDSRETRLLDYIDTALSDTRKRLCRMIGVSDQPWIAGKWDGKFSCPPEPEKRVVFIGSGGDRSDGRYSGEQRVQETGTGAEEKFEGPGPERPGG